MIEHYPDALRPQDYRERARFRQRHCGSGIGAAVERVEGSGADRRWICVVTDGGEFHYLEVRAPGTTGAVDPETIEGAIERSAALLPEPARLAALAAAGRLTLSPDELSALA